MVAQLGFLCSLVLSLCWQCSAYLVDSTGPLKIASFNIQVFGTSKYNDQDVMDILIKVSR